VREEASQCQPVEGRQRQRPEAVTLAHVESRGAAILGRVKKGRKLVSACRGAPAATSNSRALG